MPEYQFDLSNDCLLVKFHGSIDEKEVLSLYSHYLKQPEYPRELRVLIDVRKSRFQFREDAVLKFANAVEPVMKLYKSLKEAILVSNPVETALATIFIEHAQYENYVFQVFSTERAAMEWLQSANGQERSEN